jgi:hypothetical protein
MRPGNHTASGYPYDLLSLGPPGANNLIVKWQNPWRALSRYEAAIEELRAASRLPCSRVPVNYEGELPWRILLPHRACLKSCAQALRLRSVAELQNSQPDQALKDVRLSLHLTDKVRTEPLLIHQETTDEDRAAQRRPSPAESAGAPKHDQQHRKAKARGDIDDRFGRGEQNQPH